MTLNLSPSLDVRESREFASEIKFQVPESAAEPILDWARNRLVPDPNACEGGQKDGYRITSLYFDTENFDVFQRRGSFGRSKYRIRRYGSSNTVFLERKLKTGGMVTKRRAAIPIEELELMDQEEPDASWPGFWFHQRIQARKLKPICQISYQRIARVAMSENGPIRLTIDHDVRAVPLQVIRFNDSTPGLLISEEKVIVEFKFRLGMPLIFKELVEGFGLNVKRLSKYRLAAVAMGLVDGLNSAKLGVPEPKVTCLNS